MATTTTSTPIPPVWQPPFTQVLSDAEVRPLETVKVYVATVEPKLTATVLKFIRNQLPANGLDHLKQLRRTQLEGKDFRLEIMLCRESMVTAKDLQDKIVVAGLAKDIEPRIESVPLCPPLTREQFEIWRTCWPTTFRDDPHRQPRFKPEQSRVILENMDRLQNLILEAEKKGEIPVAAMMINPTDRQVLASAVDTRNSSKHVLNHAVMNCIEAVARREREAFRVSKHLAEPTGTTPSAAPVVAGHKRKADELTEETGATLAGTSSTTRSSSSGTSSTTTSSSAAIVAVGEESAEFKKAYLCTGYDLYISHEPCVMCSMALVHSRVGRVFYRTSMPASGGLGSVHKIHSHPNLNHHFFVYSGVGALPKGGAKEDDTAAKVPANIDC